MKALPKVFIIILNYNGKDVLRRTLASVFRIKYPNFEVILVDNNSQDGSFEMARNSFSRAVFIKNEENLGFSAGNNVGIRYALERRAEYVLLLNYDTEVIENFLEKMIDDAENDKKTGLFSPVILEGNSEKIWFSGGKINWLTMKTVHLTRTMADKPYHSEFLSGCALLVRKEVFQKVGLLDEDYFLYWEDADFSWRARKAGFGARVVSRSRIRHFEKSEKEESRKNKIYWLVFSGLIFFKKNSSGMTKFWIGLYSLLRRSKNYLDVKFGRNDMARIVQKAYRDFYYAKGN